MKLTENLLMYLAEKNITHPDPNLLSEHLPASYPSKIKTHSISAFEDGEQLFVSFPDEVLNHETFKSKRILDVGSGLAGRTIYYAGFGPSEIVGLEPNEHFYNESVKYTEFKGAKNVKHVKADAESMPFEDDSFDIITSLDSLEHVYEPKIVLEECMRVLKKDGVMYIIVPPYHQPRGYHLTDVFDIDFIHLLFSQKTQLPVYKKLAEKFPYGKEMMEQKIRKVNGTEEFYHINRMTYNQFQRYLKELNVRVIYSLNTINWHIPVVRKPIKKYSGIKKVVYPAAYLFGQLMSSIPVIQEVFIHRMIVAISPNK